MATVTVVAAPAAEDQLLPIPNPPASKAGSSSIDAPVVVAVPPDEHESSSSCSSSDCCCEDVARDDGSCDDYNSCCSSTSTTAGSSVEGGSSVDTNEAFLEMLGLPFPIPGVDDEDNDEGEGLCGPPPSPLRNVMMLDDDESESSVADCRDGRPQERPTAAPIALPPRCSRHLHPPSACLAFTSPHLLTPAQCRSIVKTAATQSQGFHYVTEASHTMPDGSSYTVQLQNPNPHKLCVFEGDDAFLGVLWGKIRNLLLGGDAGDAASDHAAAAARSQFKCFQERTQCRMPLGLNPRLRVLKYDAADDDRFEPHFDATTSVGADRKSLLTVLVYLNDGGGNGDEDCDNEEKADFAGGETLYLNHHVSDLGGPSEKDDAGNGGECGSSGAMSSSSNVVPSAGTVVIFEHDLYHSSAPLTWGTKYVMRTDVLFDGDVREYDDGDRKDEGSVVENDAGDAGDSQRRETGPRGSNERRQRADTEKCDGEVSVTEREEDGPSPPRSVSDLATLLDLSDDDRAYLDGMGVLNGTAEAFLAPGATALRLMLRDGMGSNSSGASDGDGDGDDKVDALIRAAVDEIARQK